MPWSALKSSDVLRQEITFSAFAACSLFFSVVQLQPPSIPVPRSLFYTVQMEFTLSTDVKFWRGFSFPPFLMDRTCVDGDLLFPLAEDYQLTICPRTR